MSDSLSKESAADLLDGERREVLSIGYRELSGVRHHWSDCAIHNAPAEIPGPCDCPAPWKPMHTAPVDGTEILIAGGTYYSDQDPFPNMDHSFLAQTIASWDQDGWCGRTVAHEEWEWHKPLCWLPLPELPNRINGGQTDGE